jgi:4-amino-4-deoxy-L-arabinose transferase-like glycosyltransferase
VIRDTGIDDAVLRPGVRRRAALAWITGAAFVGAILSRSVWFPDAPFHPDESTVLWMALDAVRYAQIPDHGLVSSYHVFQPPGLVWLTMPFVALGGGRPEVVIVAFALLNATAIAALVATVARFWGLVYASVLGVLLVVGPDAYFSAWVWHPSLYTGAMALMLAAGIRLRHGSAWWALVLVAVPGLYALIHYSGFVLFAPALVLLVLSRRTWSSLLLPILSGAGLAACAWVPFLSFESDRDWVDLRTLVDASDSSGSLGAKLHDRLSALVFAISHLGESLHGSVHLSRLIWALVLVALLVAVVRRRWRDPGFALPAAVLGAGLAAQVAVDQGERTDVLMLWLVPLYALSAWAVVQIVELMRLAVRRPATRPTFAVFAVLFVAAIGSIDLANSIRSTPYDIRLSDEWRDAQTQGPVRYPAGVHPAASENHFYLACDPPYDWESEIWYLEDVLHPGRGRKAALERGAFRWRPTCRDS